jgi:hypothetical protein
MGSGRDAESHQYSTGLPLVQPVKKHTIFQLSAKERVYSKAYVKPSPTQVGTSKKSVL